MSILGRILLFSMPIFGGAYFSVDESNPLGIIMAVVVAAAVFVPWRLSAEGLNRFLLLTVTVSSLVLMVIFFFSPYLGFNIFIVLAMTWMPYEVLVIDKWQLRVKAFRSIITNLYGVVIMFAGFVLCTLVFSGDDEMMNGASFGPLVIAIGMWLMNLGKRRGMLSAEEALREDPDRPPVLYLRSFKTDEKEDRSIEEDYPADQNQPMWWKDGKLQPEPRKKNNSPSWLAKLFADPFRVHAREEEIIAPALKVLGPFVAIGHPGESLPQLGASRIYVGDDLWKEKVEELMAQAKLVIIRVGMTPGLEWEIERALETLKHDQIVFYFSHYLDSTILNKAYEGFCNIAQPHIRASLPEKIDRHRILTFDAQLQPILLGRYAKFNFQIPGFLWDWMWVPLHTAKRRKWFSEAIRPILEKA